MDIGYTNKSHAFLLKIITLAAVKTFRKEYGLKHIYLHRLNVFLNKAKVTPQCNRFQDIELIDPHATPCKQSMFISLS